MLKGRWISIALAVVLALGTAILMRESEEDAKSLSPAVLAKWATDRTFLVTGANAGLGFHTVKHLVQTGTAKTVVMACRNEQRCQDAKQEILSTVKSTASELETVSLDLASLGSIQQCSQYLKKSNITSLTIVLNAGIMGETHDIQYSAETGVEHHMQVNHLGHFYLTHLLFPVVDRVVLVSSLAGAFPFKVIDETARKTDFSGVDPRSGFAVGRAYRAWMYYCKSKRANLLMASELHRRYGTHTKGNNGHTVSVTASHPGYTRSRIMLTGFQWAPHWLRSWLHRNTIGSMSPQDGSLSQIRAALDPTLISSSAVSYVGPRFATFGHPVVLGSLDSGSWNHWPLSHIEASALWEWSLQRLKIQEFGKPSLVR